jgi:hypothetical protein
MTLTETFEQYKRGEYIKEFDDDRLQYLKVVDRIPEQIRKDLFWYDERIAKKVQRNYMLLAIIYAVLGGIAGYVIGVGA